jgi:integrase
VLQERLGHSTIASTLDVYSHVTPGLQEAAVKWFDDAVQIKHNNNVPEKSVSNNGNVK